MEEKHLVEEETPHKGKTPRLGRTISFVSVLQSFVLYRVFSKKILSVLRGLQWFSENFTLHSVVGK